MAGGLSGCLRAFFEAADGRVGAGGLRGGLRLLALLVLDLQLGLVGARLRRRDAVVHVGLEAGDLLLEEGQRLGVLVGALEEAKEANRTHDGPSIAAISSWLVVRGIERTTESTH